MGSNYFRRDDRDLRFLLFEYINLDRLLTYRVYRDFSLDDIRMILDEALKVGRTVLGPTMQDGDKEGCIYQNGQVKVPSSFHDCWRFLAQNGWMATTHNPEFGGQGLPAIVGGILGEIFGGANQAMMHYPGLTAGCGRLIETFGIPEDKALFVKKMYTGVWGGSMCMTEPEAGSDVGCLRTKAVPDLDANDPRLYKIEGTKRFISVGEHDLTENIIHLVLARIEGAPNGTKGLSLFIVPKIWVNKDGTLGDGNDVFCTGIEHKMGLHGSCTCSLVFGENGRCRGILLGEPHSGMAKMFQMLNWSRLGTGVQALALSACAYDTALLYAKERVQGAPFKDWRADRVPIIRHEDVRRMLMNLKAGTEAMRAFIGKTNYLLDMARHDPDQQTRQKALDQVGLFTPLVKAYCSDFGYYLIRDAIQVLGGVGYCRDFPVEQYARDSKALSVYEGTAYIQALDLVGRKLPSKEGQIFQDWLQGVLAFASKNKEDKDFGPDFNLLFKAAQLTGDFALRYKQYFQGEKNHLVALSATRFLDCMSEVAMAHFILEQGLLARRKLAQVENDSAPGVFYRGKMETVKYFCRNILPNVFSRHICIEQEDTSALDIAEEAL